MAAPLSLDFARRPYVMGIVNVTPDSFSGDGLINREDAFAAALAQAERMIADGADMLDIGGESSRPGSTSVSVEEEIRRTAPVIAAIHEKHPSLPLSIDTVKTEVAAAALKAGAVIINDISGDRQEPAIRKLAAAQGAYLVLMDNRSSAEAVTRDARIGGVYQAPASADIVAEVRDDLRNLADTAMADGVAKERIILDPGYGFGKTVEQNLRLVNELDKLVALGFPVLAGPSRKSFIGLTLDAPVEDRLEGTAAVVAACVLRGAAILRVHDVKEMAKVVKMVHAIACH